MSSRAPAAFELLSSSTASVRRGAAAGCPAAWSHDLFGVYQDTFLKSTHTLRAQKWVPKRIISRNTAPPVPFLAPIRSATAGRALTRRPFVDRVGNRRVTDDFVSAATSPATLGSVSKVCPNALAGARGGAGGFSCPHTSAHDQGRHPPSTVCQSDV